MATLKRQTSELTSRRSKVDEEGEEVKGKGKGEVGGPSGRRSPLELWLLDPRAPALRLEAFGGAAA